METFVIYKLFAKLYKANGTGEYSIEHRFEKPVRLRFESGKGYEAFRQFMQTEGLKALKLSTDMVWLRYVAVWTNNHDFTSFSTLLDVTKEDLCP